MPKLYAVKIGTNSVFHGGEIDNQVLESLGCDLAKLKFERDTDAFLVTSGAIPLGMQEKGIAETPTNSTELQSCARVGQPLLIEAYRRGLQSGYSRYLAEKEMDPLEIRIGQYLATYHNLDMPEELRNIVGNIFYDISDGVVPQANYNDGIDPTEVDRDNDTFAARITKAVIADLLAILTNVDGLMGHDDNLVPVVREITDEVRAYCGDAEGTGGMVTKLDAADLCLRNDPPIPVIVGNAKHSLVDLIDGTVPRTLFQN